MLVTGNMINLLLLKLEFCSAQISGKTWKPWKLRNLFSSSWTSCERRNLTAKHFILNDELGGVGRRGRGGGGSPEKFSMQFTDSKSQQQSPPCCFSSNNSTCYFCSALRCVLFYVMLYCVVLCYNTIQYNTIQCNTIIYFTSITLRLNTGITSLALQVFAC